MDLEACVWLEDYLSTYTKILIVISHSQDFLNGVCTDMMVMQQQKLRYWSGNYDQYMNTQDSNQFDRTVDYLPHNKNKKEKIESWIAKLKQLLSTMKLDFPGIEKPYHCLSIDDLNINLVMQYLGRASYDILIFRSSIDKQ